MISSSTPNPGGAPLPCAKCYDSVELLYHARILVTSGIWVPSLQLILSLESRQTFRDGWPCGSQGLWRVSPCVEELSFQKGQGRYFSVVCYLHAAVGVRTLDIAGSGCSQAQWCLHVVCTLYWVDIKEQHWTRAHFAT